MLDRDLGHILSGGLYAGQDSLPWPGSVFLPGYPDTNLARIGHTARIPGYIVASGPLDVLIPGHTSQIECLCRVDGSSARWICVPKGDSQDPGYSKNVFSRIHLSASIPG